MLFFPFDIPPRNKAELITASDKYYADRRVKHNAYMEAKRNWSYANPHHEDSAVFQHNKGMQLINKLTPNKK